MSEQLIETGVFHLAPADYHEDRRTKRPTLSRSMAKTLVTKTPRHLLAASPRLQAEFPEVEVVPVKPKETETYDIGRAAHAVLLGRGGDIDVVNAKTWTPKASEARNVSRAAGRTALLLHQYEATQRMAGIARRKLDEAKVALDPSRSEMAAYAEIDGVVCRAMIDNAPEWPGAPILDYKTCEDASEEACLRAVESYEYDFQDRWYREVWKAATGETRRMLFLFQEKDPPHECQLVDLYEGRGDGDWNQDAAEKCSEARRIFRNSLETGEWPGYPANRIVTLYARGFHRAKWANRQTISAPSAAALLAARTGQSPRRVGDE